MSEEEIIDNVNQLFKDNKECFETKEEIEKFINKLLAERN